MKMLNISLCIALSLGTVLLLPGCGQATAAKTPPLTAVTTMSPVTDQVLDSIQMDGVVAPSATVNLVARVSGYLQAAPFTEGQQVKAGQTLFVIEPAPYQQQIRINQAKRDQLATEYQRQQVLLKQNATAASSVEMARSNLEQADANLKLAQINYGYTQVKAPFDGIIGRKTLDVGNYVGANAGGTVLATLNAVQPVNINFSLNERDLLRLLNTRTVARGATLRSLVEHHQIRVLASLQGESAPSETGTLDFIDSNLASGSGSLALRARFENQDRRLIPGLYAHITIVLGAPRPALLLPAALIQSDQRGDYVYVVDSHARVVRREIQSGNTFGQLKEISHGLAVDEKVIVSGSNNVSIGQQVVASAAPTTAY